MKFHAVPGNQSPNVHSVDSDPDQCSVEFHPVALTMEFLGEVHGNTALQAGVGAFTQWFMGAQAKKAPYAPRMAAGHYQLKEGTSSLLHIILLNQP